MGVSQPQQNNSPTRIEPLAKLPVFWTLEGKRCIISGGSDAAAWKAELLAACGAHVEIYAENPLAMMRALIVHPAVHAEARISLVARHWLESDLLHAAIAVADCDDDDEASAFHAACKRAGVPVNIIDKPRYCQFQFGSIINRSPVIVAISTDGAAPVLAQTIRSKIEVLLPGSLKAWAEFAQTLRSHVNTLLPTSVQRRHFWKIFADKAFSEHLTAQTEAELLDLTRDLDSNGRHEQFFLVAPQDPEQLTIKVVRSLQTADVIYFDQDIAPEILDFGRREAKRIPIGNTFGLLSQPNCHHAVYLRSGRVLKRGSAAYASCE